MAKTLTLALVLISTIALAADFQQAKLLDVISHKQANPVVPVAVYDMVTITVAINGMSYTATYYASKHLRSADLIVGDFIPAKLDNTELLIKLPDGKEIKSKIVRRERLPQKETQ